MLPTALILVLILPGVPGRFHGDPGEAPGSTIASGAARAAAQPRVSQPEGLAEWLSRELLLTPFQKQRVHALLERERFTQAAARAEGHDLQNAPPVPEVLFLPEDARPPDPDTRRRPRGATAVLREAARRKRAAEWLAENAARTELAPELRGLRVTALDGILRVLTIEQTQRYRELLGDQGVEWLRELARHRTKPLPPPSAALRADMQRAEAFAREQKKRQAKEQAEARAAARRKAQEEARSRRGGGRGARGRGGRGGRRGGASRGRGRGRGRRR